MRKFAAVVAATLALLVAGAPAQAASSVDSGYNFPGCRHCQ